MLLMQRTIPLYITTVYVIVKIFMLILHGKYHECRHLYGHIPLLGLYSLYLCVLLVINPYFIPLTLT